MNGLLAVIPELNATQLLVLLIVTLPSILCFIISAVLAAKEKEGWGWFLFVGVVIACSDQTIMSVLHQ